MPFFMQKNNNRISILYKGFLIGATMLVPGVSGGSMAMLLGIYDRLVASVSSFFKNKKENSVFLILFVLGAGVGMFILSKPILVLWELYPKIMGFFFMGAVAGGVPAIYKEAGVNKLSWKELAYILIGFLVVVFMAVAENNVSAVMSGQGEGNILFLLIAGVIAAIALVLPGISVSFLLLFLGLYDELMRAVSELDISFLLPLGSGIILGILLTTKFLEYIMTKYPKVTYFVILGFVIGSLLEVFPGVPIRIEWIWCMGALAAGGIFIASLSLTEKE